ncbi:YceD family protein [Crenothrix sp.]|uniref:YceD family protein n=1 Tax=Crenothrix sp. TaxID=3100433 RepID=UPI00374C9E23
MLYRLPEYIDPLQLADNRGELKGQIPVSELDRLNDLLIADTGSVTVALFFGREGRLPKIEGTLETELNLCCQNCLQAVAWPVKHTVKLGIVKTIEQADRLPEDFEPLLITTDTVFLKEIIEDELLLTLPTYPKHPYDCLALHKDIKNSDTDTGQAHKKNPFSILANLKNTGDLNGSTKK